MTQYGFRAFPTLKPGVVRMEALLADFAYPLHSHDHLCVGLMLDGEKTSRYGLQRYTVGRGDLVLVNPGEVHDGRPSGWHDRRYTMLEIDAGVFRELCADTVGKDWVEFQQPVLRDRRAGNALRRWLAGLKGTDDAFEREASAVFLGMLTSPRDHPRGQRAISDVAAAAGHRIKQRLADSEAIGQLAIEIGLSRYQLIRAFKEVFGLTPEAFRRQARVQRARSLLGSKRKLVDIAADAGFADQSHMTREFRRLVGPSPAVYRSALQ